MTMQWLSIMHTITQPVSFVCIRWARMHWLVYVRLFYQSTSFVRKFKKAISRSNSTKLQYRKFLVILGVLRCILVHSEAYREAHRAS